jgi:hypothetical protein
MYAVLPVHTLIASSLGLRTERCKGKRRLWYGNCQSSTPCIRFQHSCPQLNWMTVHFCMRHPRIRRAKRHRRDYPSPLARMTSSHPYVKRSFTTYSWHLINPSALGKAIRSTPMRRRRHPTSGAFPLSCCPQLRIHCSRCEFQMSIRTNLPFRCLGRALAPQHPPHLLRMLPCLHQAYC